MCRESAVVIVETEGQSFAVPGRAAEGLTIAGIHQDRVQRVPLPLNIDAEVHLAGFALNGAIPQPHRRLGFHLRRESQRDTTMLPDRPSHCASRVSTNVAKRTSPTKN